MSFAKNLEVVEKDFSEAMLMPAGKNCTVADVFTALRDLESRKFASLNEMWENTNFNSQNVVYKTVNALLKDMGTPVNSLRSSKRKPKLAGTEFALNMLSKKNLSLSEKKNEQVEETESV